MSTREFVVTVQEMKTTLEKVTVFKAVCRSEGPVEPPPRGAGGSVSDADPLKPVPRCMSKKGQVNRQPEGVWPSSHVVFRTRPSPTGLTLPLTFPLSASLPPTYYPENYVSKKKWKAALCSIDCELRMCPYGCVSFAVCVLGWNSCRFSTSVQYNYADWSPWRAMLPKGTQTCFNWTLGGLHPSFGDSGCSPVFGLWGRTKDKKNWGYVPCLSTSSSLPKRIHKEVADLRICLSNALSERAEHPAVEISRGVVGVGGEAGPCLLAPKNSTVTMNMNNVRKSLSALVGSLPCWH